MSNRLENILVEIPTNTDARGEAVKVMTVQKSGWPARDVIAVSTEPGIVRGNHYHKLKEEVLVVVSGKILARLIDTETKEQKEMVLESTKRQMLFLHPYVAHAIKNIGTETAWFVEVQNTDYDKGDDYKYEVLV